MVSYFQWHFLLSSDGEGMIGHYVDMSEWDFLFPQCRQFVSEGSCLDLL